jgi:hypothetical protein
VIRVFGGDHQALPAGEHPAPGVKLMVGAFAAYMRLRATSKAPLTMPVVARMPALPS